MVNVNTVLAIIITTTIHLAHTMHKIFCGSWLIQCSQWLYGLVTSPSHVTDEEPERVRGVTEVLDLRSKPMPSSTTRPRLPLSPPSGTQGLDQTSGSCPPSLPLAP